MTKPSSQINAEARKVLRHWARDGLYTYIRPVSSKLIDPTAKFHIVWKISVEYRGVGWKQYHNEGANLSEVIIRMGLEIPRKSKLKKEPLGSGKVVNFSENENKVIAGIKKDITEAMKVQPFADRPRRRPKDKKRKKAKV